LQHMLSVVNDLKWATDFRESNGLIGGSH